MIELHQGSLAGRNTKNQAQNLKRLHSPNIQCTLYMLNLLKLNSSVSRSSYEVQNQNAIFLFV